MARASGQSSFWAGGLKVYQQERQREWEEQLAPLRPQLKTEMSKEIRSQIKAENRRIGRDFKTKELAARYLLFGRQ